MSRARSPRASIRGLFFDKEKIRSFGRACRLARQYFNGGVPKDGCDRAEDDPDHQAGWNLVLLDVSYHTGIPISSISEIENHASYTLGYDSAATLARFLWLNSKNRDLLKPFLEMAFCCESLLTISEEIVRRNEFAGLVPISKPLDTPLPLLPIPPEGDIDTPREDIPASPPVPPVSKEFLRSVQFLIEEWARLTDSSERSAVRAARIPVEELEILKRCFQEEGEADDVQHPDYDRFWDYFDFYVESFDKRYSKRTLVKKISQDIEVAEDLVELLVYSNDPDHPASEGPEDKVRNQWSISDLKKLLSKLRDRETGKRVTIGELSSAIGIDLTKRKAENGL